MRVKALIQIEGSEKPYKEEHEVVSIETAEEEIRAIIDIFNDTLKPYEKPRKFVELLIKEYCKDCVNENGKKYCRIGILMMNKKFCSYYKQRLDIK